MIPKTQLEMTFLHGQGNSIAKETQASSPLVDAKLRDRPCAKERT